MRGDLYLGDVVTKGLATTDSFIFDPIRERKITLRPSFPSTVIGNVYEDYPRFIDFLYYNRVNEVGDVLTSLVYMGDFRAENKGVKISYDPDRLFKNSVTENLLNINAENSNFTGFNYIVPGEELGLGQTQNVSYTEFQRDGLLSNMVGVQDVAFDGWYTLMSIFVISNENHFSTIPKDSVALRGTTYIPEQALIDGSNITVDANWISGTEFIDPLLNLGYLPYSNIILNNYQKVDFFVSYDFRQLYIQELEKQVELKYRVGHDTIIEKGKAMGVALTNNGFKSAQKILQSVEDTILLNITG